MSRGRVAVLVSNDLAFDQRVRKTCATLQQAGHDPVLIGRRMARTDPTSIERPYLTERIWLGVSRGPIFYAVLQLGLWRALKRLHREGGVTAVGANDLDTLGPAVKAARRFGWSIAYDSHEWFTEAEGLKGKPMRRAVWQYLERRCFRHIDRMITVNDAIAEAYRKQGLEVEVVPNVPERLGPAGQPAAGRRPRVAAGPQPGGACGDRLGWGCLPFGRGPAGRGGGRRIRRARAVLLGALPACLHFAQV